jgi:hypothetical protein
MGLRGSRYIGALSLRYLSKSLHNRYPNREQMHTKLLSRRETVLERTSSKLQLMMYVSGKCDNKREYKRTARQQPAQYYASQTRPHVASGSLFHHRCAANLPLNRRLRSGEGHRPYSARCLQIRRDGRGFHRVCNAAAPSLRVVEQWIQLCLK